MVWGDPGKPVAIAAIIVLSLSTLAGCSAAGSGERSLADTKSPVQLLRNEAASRIPPAAIDAVGETEDVSKPCESEADDPDGLRRAWHSSTQVVVEAASAWRVDAIVDGIGTSFADQGWTVTPVDDGDLTHGLTLTREETASELRVSAHRPEAGTAAPAADSAEPVTIDVASHGPCVDTAGADSDEVTELEAQK